MSRDGQGSSTPAPGEATTDQAVAASRAHPPRPGGPPATTQTPEDPRAQLSHDDAGGGLVDTQGLDARRSGGGGGGGGGDEENAEVKEVELGAGQEVEEEEAQEKKKKKKKKEEEEEEEGELTWADDPRTTFSIGQFVEQLLIHVALPFSVSYVWMRWGDNGLRAQSFNVVGASVSGLLSCYCYPSLVWTAFALYGGYRQSMKDRSISVAEILVPFALLFTHRCMVALKYGSLSRSEYERLLGSKDGLRLQNSVQLINGWLVVSPFTQSVEIAAAASREDVSLEAHPFVVPPPATHNGEPIEPDPRIAWRKFVGREDAMWEDADGQLHVAADGYSLALTSRANETTDIGGYQLLILLAAIVFAGIPGAVRMTTSDCDLGETGCHAKAFFGHTVPEVFVVVASMLVTFLFFTTNSFFLSIAVIDLARLFTILNLCTETIRVTRDQRRKPRQDQWGLTPVPRVDLTIPTNVQAWIYARLVLGDFGRRYRTRLGTFFVVALAVSFALLLILTLRVVIEFNSATSLATAEYPYSIIFLDVFWVGLCLAFVYFGSQINDLYAKTRRQLIRHRLTLQDIQLAAVDDARTRQELHGDQDGHTVLQTKETKQLRNTVLKWKHSQHSAMAGIPFEELAAAPEQPNSQVLGETFQSQSADPDNAPHSRLLRASTAVVALARVRRSIHSGNKRGPDLQASASADDARQRLRSQELRDSLIQNAQNTLASGRASASASVSRGSGKPHRELQVAAQHAQHEESHLTQLYELLNSCTDLMETLEVSRPVRVLGTRADMNLASSIATVTVTVLAFLFQQIWLGGQD